MGRLLHNSYVLITLLLAGIFAFQVNSSYAQSIPRQSEYIPGTLIIKFAEDQAASKQRPGGMDAQKQVTNYLSQFGGQVSLEPMLNESQQQRLQKISSRSDQLARKVNKIGINRIYKARFDARANMQVIASKLSRMPGVEYAEPHYINYTTSFTPNDYNSTRSGYLEYHRFLDAWDITKASENIVIAIIDSGVDYRNEDLQNKLWTNEDEIADDGVDNDDNQYVDDVKGWDFWDSGPINNPTQDGDPLVYRPANSDTTYSAHGTHVAGISAAETDNNTGIAGSGFNARYMAVKTGLGYDNPNTPDVEEDKQIPFGYQGILYAAINGADVINCSWGGYSASSYGRDVVKLATELGSVIIGAAGNETADQVIYPAAFDEVLAVSALSGDQGTIAGYSNYGYKTDVFAVGSGIYSTVFSTKTNSEGEPDPYGYMSGTSMATPVVSGLAALVKSQHPDWSPMRIQKQIRATANPVYDENPDAQYEYKLGRGSIDALAALGDSKPGLSLVSANFVNQQNEKLFIGEDGKAIVRLTNYGAATENLQLTLKPLVDNINVTSAGKGAGVVQTGDTLTVEFNVTIENDFQPGQTNRPRFVVEMTDDALNYDDFQYLEYDNMLYNVLANNRVKTSFASDASIGWVDPLQSQGGVGFIPRDKVSGGYEDRPNVLFEGGLIMEINGKVADAVRGQDGDINRDFAPETIYSLQDPGQLSEVDGQAKFNTSNDPGIGTRTDITMRTYSFADSSLSNVVFVRYDIRNPWHSDTLNNVYVGLFNDWDIGTALQNSSDYSASDSLLYVYDSDFSNTNAPYVAVAHMNPISSAHAIDNNYGANGAQEDSLNFSIYQGQGDYSGFVDIEKKWALHAQTLKTRRVSTDVSTVVATGPYTIGPKADITVGFIYAFGDNLTELRNQVKAARERNLFETSIPGVYTPIERTTNELPQRTKLYSNYPNPFNPTTSIKFDLAGNSEVQLEVFNILGQKVATLVDQRLQAGSHTYQFDAGSLSSGIYLAILKTQEGIQTVKMNLIK